MMPCNACDNGGCGSCIAEKLERDGHIRSAKTHCGCAETGHNNITELNRPKVKSMFSKVKDDEPHVPEQEVIEE